MGRSKAQDNLQRRIERLFPENYVNDEIYIGDLIDARGYSKKEIEYELGHKAHKMFVDIVMYGLNGTMAFEYHGEQHFHVIKGMTGTHAELMANQMLDQEKSWILNRIGIPLVSILYDDYIDDETLLKHIQDAVQECEKENRQLLPCENCGRLFPPTILSYGHCPRCLKTTESDNNHQQSQHRNNQTIDNSHESKQDMKKEENKQKQREYRKRRYQEYKNSPAYQESKNKARLLRKQQYEKAKKYKILHKKKND